MVRYCRFYADVELAFYVREIRDVLDEFWRGKRRGLGVVKVTV